MIATSTALLLAGVAAAGGTAASAAMSSSAAKNAAKVQGRATDAALQFEREREAQRRKEYDDAMVLQKQQWEARQRTRQALARRYGFDLPTYEAPPAGGSPTAPSTSQPKLSLGAMMGAQPNDPTRLEASLSDAGPAGAEPAMPQTLGDLAGWEQWQKYGLS